MQTLTLTQNINVWLTVQRKQNIWKDSLIFNVHNKKDVGKEAQSYVLANSPWTDGAPEAVRLHFSCKKVAI